MQINVKANNRVIINKDVEDFIARGGVITVVKNRKAPKRPTANGKNKGVFNASKIFAVGV